jgi:RimJ/RimL family protein N-acetyltransferase
MGMLRPDYPITTERLILRPFSSDDLDALNAFQSRADVARYLYWGPRSRAESATALAKRVRSSTLRQEGQFLAVAVELASTGHRNTASASLMERLGMRKEAHLRETEIVKGEWTDELVFAMLEDERKAGNRPG